MLIPITQVYMEPLRPQFHFTAQTGWLNDPNGLVYSGGEYHLFFQHNPFGTQWGNMTWGHAVSKDLIHWKQLENAITPDELGTMYSGSAVIDKNNTAGFGKNALVCIYTAAGGENEQSKGKPYTQCLAWSLDGRNFTKFTGNPILPNLANGNRDPKVIWHAPSKKWVLALYLDGDRYAIFNSSDLKAWTKICDVSMPGTSECPDFFELPVDGDTQKKQWVFWGANGNYRLGTFDGIKFTPTTAPIRSNFGNTSYAAQTYYNDPKGRRVQIAWFQNSEFPGCTWNQQMGFPTTLALKSTSDGPRLTINPINEVRSLRAHKVALKDNQFQVSTGLFDLSGTWKVPTTGILKLTLNGVVVTFDAEKHTLSALDKTTSIDTSSGTLQLRVLADKTTLEIYAQNGLVSMPLFMLPKPNSFAGVLVEKTGTWTGRLDVWELKSAW